MYNSQPESEQNAFYTNRMISQQTGPVSATSRQREDLIKACAKGDDSEIRKVLRVASPQPLASLDPSLAADMLIAAIASSRLTTVSLILTLFPQGTPIPEEAVRKALLSPSAAMYQTLYTYDPRIIHYSIFEGRETQLGKALSVPCSPSRLSTLLSFGLTPTFDPFSTSELALACGPWQTQSTALCTLLLSHGASLQHSGILAAAAKTGSVELVRWVLEQGADVNDAITNIALAEHPCRGHPVPALHVAVENGHADVVMLLLRKGADLRLLDGEGRTAFEIAREREKGGAENMVALLDIMQGS